MHLSWNHWNHSLSTGICIPCPSGPEEPGKRSSCSCNSHCLFSWASSWRYASHLWHVQCGAHSIWFQTFPLLRATRAVKIFVLEFSKDGSADLGDKFADGGAANQPVIMQGGVGLSRGQVSQGYGHFESNFQWLPEIGD